MISKEKLAEIVPALKQKHGDDLHLLTAQDEQVIVRVPNGAEYQRFLDTGAGDRHRGSALDAVLRSCTVFPDPAALDQLLDRRPGLATTFGAKAIELAGVVDEVAAKKL